MSGREQVASITPDEISALTTSLNDQLERLEFLTAGEVDTVMDPHGRTFLLRRAQNELRQREAVRQAAILDALPAQIALLDGDGVIVSTNQSWRDHAVAVEAHGPGHSIGIDYLALCEHASGHGVDESRRVAAGVRGVMAGRDREFSLEYASHAAGRECWHLITATPLPDQFAHGAVVMHFDITHRKLTQAALDELSRTTSRTERILSTTLGAIVDFAYIFDRDGRFLFANRALSDLLGLDEGALVGRTFLELGYPAELAAKLQGQVEYVFNVGQGITDVTPFEYASGEPGLFEYIFTPVVAADGTVEYVAGSTRDITAHHKTMAQNTALIAALEQRTLQLEDANGALRHDIVERTLAETALREAEVERLRNEAALRDAERFSRATIDALTKSLCVLDEVGTIVRVNKAWREFAAANAGDLLPVCEGANYLAVCDAAASRNDPDASRFAAGIRSVAAGASAEFSMEYACHSPNEQRWFLGRISGFEGNGNRRVVVTHENITWRKQAEEKLVTLNEGLEQKVVARTLALDKARHEAEVASRAKSEFLATMSHEIRTPMNGVVGMIDVLQQSSLRADQTEMVELIRESAFSLLGIITDILDVSKIEAGKLELESEPFAFENVVEGVGTLLNGMAIKKDVTLTLFIDTAIPAQLVGDALRLRQVLTNLVNNAIKFSSGQSRPGRVSMRAMLVETGLGRTVVDVEVADNGVGMDDGVRARLFTAFAQADASTTRRFGGTGLGLAIAHHLVTLMGGSITARSAAGEGSSFRIRVPFASPPELAAGRRQPSVLAGLTCVVVGGGGLADDMATYLLAAGAQVEREADLPGARQRQAGRNGLAVWIVDADDATQASASTLAAVRTDRDVRFVVVLVARGRRSRLRQVDSDTLMIDRNAMGRRTFLRAVAIAAGRASPDTMATTPPAVGKVTIAPTRELALREGRLILVAEDNENNRQVIVRQLALLGYAADVAADGREALALWSSTDYALLVTDLHMPHMDGYELAKAIRAGEDGRTRKPIIALTANALKGEDQRCRAQGMDDYRSKPAPLSELKAVLEKWMPGGAATEVAPGRPVAAAPVNVDVLRALVGEEPEVVTEILDCFRKSAASMAAELRANCTAGRFAAAAGTAHKLKPAARAIGAFELAEICAGIESEARTGNAALVMALLSRFEAEMAAVNAFLDN